MVGFYLNEENKKVPIFLSSYPVAYAGNGIFIHKEDGHIAFSKAEMGIVDWMHEHGCLKKEIEQMVYG